MLSDFELITHEIKTRDPIYIYPISDVHLGAAEHMEREWKRFCDHLLDNPNAYITLGGDLVNNAVKTSVSNVYDEKLRPREQKKLMTEMLTPLKSRILCAVSGNHERRSSKDIDDDITYDILCKLDLEHLYRENIAFVKIQAGDKKGSGIYNPTYILTVTHGAGGGALTGGTVNRNERFGYMMDGCDCLITGHNHRPFITSPSKIVIDSRLNKISVKSFKVVSATSWLGYSGYAIQKMLPASSYCPQVITLSSTRKRIDVTMMG